MSELISEDRGCALVNKASLIKRSELFLLIKKGEFPSPDEIRSIGENKCYFWKKIKVQRFLASHPKYMNPYYKKERFQREDYYSNSQLVGGGNYSTKTRMTNLTRGDLQSLLKVNSFPKPDYISKKGSFWEKDKIDKFLELNPGFRNTEFDQQLEFDPVQEIELKQDDTDSDVTREKVDNVEKISEIPLNDLIEGVHSILEALLSIQDDFRRELYPIWEIIDKLSFNNSLNQALHALILNEPKGNPRELAARAYEYGLAMHAEINSHREIPAESQP
jgi:predicted DNA-binding transcriptional regulator AlpA